MPPKRFKLDAEKGYIGDTKNKYKPKPYVEPEWIKEYRKDRYIAYYIKHGGECLWTDDEIELVRGKYFKTLF